MTTRVRDALNRKLGFRISTAEMRVCKPYSALCIRTHRKRVVGRWYMGRVGGVVSSCPIAHHHTRGGLYDSIVSQSLLPVCPWGTSLGRPLAFLRGSCSMCSCRLGVSMAGGEFRIFLHHPFFGPIYFCFTGKKAIYIFPLTGNNAYV